MIQGSKFLLVRITGLEPAHLAVQEPKSCASASFATSARNWQGRKDSNLR